MRPFEDRLDTFYELSDLIGADRVIWRYDPIIISNLTPVRYHLNKLAEMGHKLRHFTRRLVISFVDYYDFVLKRMGKIDGLEIFNLNAEQIETMCQHIVDYVGYENYMQVVSCAESIACVTHGACIDADLIFHLFGKDFRGTKDGTQRASCLCAPSIDIGEYNTCPNNCQYCYANKKTV